MAVGRSIIWNVFSFIFIMKSVAGMNFSDEVAEARQKSGNMLQRRDGDVILGAILPIHSRWSQERCGGLKGGSVQAVETINMMVEKINADDSLLPGVNIGTVIIDSCDVDTHALQKIVIKILPMVWTHDADERIVSGAKKTIFAGMMGAAGSTISIETTKILQIFNIPQVSYWSTHPELSDKTRYKYFFRVVPSDKHQTNAIIRLLKLYEWNFVSIVYENDHYGTKGYSELSQLTDQNGICIAVAQQVPRNPTTQDFDRIVSKLLEQGQARAVILFLKDTDADNFFKAIHKNEKARGYFVFIGTEGWMERIPVDAESNKYIPSLNGSIGFLPVVSHVPHLDDYFHRIKLSSRPRQDGSLNPWYSEYLSTKLECNVPGVPTKYNETCATDANLLSDFTHYTSMQNVADTVLSFAHSLHKVHQSLCGSQRGVCSKMSAMAGTNSIAKLVYEELKTISFTSINGELFKFDSSQDGQAKYSVVKYINNNSTFVGRKPDDWKRVGKYFNNNISLNEPFQLKEANSSCSQKCKPGEYRVEDTEKCCWTCTKCADDEIVINNGTKCQICPIGEKPTEDRYFCIKLPINTITFTGELGIACLVVGIVGMLLTAIVCYIYIIYRNSPIVKASGKELCFIMFFGIFLTFMNSLFITTSLPMCFIFRLILSLGPTIMYSALITKSIRIMMIFKSKQLLSPQVKTFLQPLMQVIATVAITAVQIFLTLAWFLKYPVNAVLVPDPVKDMVFQVCSDMTGYGIFLGTVYHIILLIICAIIATLNRKVPSGFNETQLVIFTVYTTLIVWLAFVAIFLTNDNRYLLKMMITSICLSLNAALGLCSLFGYRCYTMVCHPERNTQKNVMAPSSFVAQSDQSSDKQVHKIGGTKNNNGISEDSRL